MTHNRLTRYEQLILVAENVNICRCLVLNPATLMPMPCNDEDSECENDCLEVRVMYQTKTWLLPKR